MGFSTRKWRIFNAYKGIIKTINGKERQTTCLNQTIFMRKKIWIILLGVLAVAIGSFLLYGKIFAALPPGPLISITTSVPANVDQGSTVYIGYTVDPRGYTTTCQWNNLGGSQSITSIGPSLVYTDNKMPLYGFSSSNSTASITCQNAQGTNTRTMAFSVWNKVSFNVISGVQQYVVPSGVSTIGIAVKGAGGGQGGGEGGSNSYPGANGGKGGVTVQFVNVTAGSAINIVAGGKGHGGGYNSGGGGGGASAAYYPSDGSSFKIIAGGGGGGGADAWDGNKIYGGVGGMGGTTTGGGGGGGAGNGAGTTLVDNNSYAQGGIAGGGGGGSGYYPGGTSSATGGYGGVAIGIFSAGQNATSSSGCGLYGKGGNGGSLLDAAGGVCNRASPTAGGDGLYSVTGSAITTNLSNAFSYGSASSGGSGGLQVGNDGSDGAVYIFTPSPTPPPPAPIIELSAQNVTMNTNSTAYSKITALTTNVSRLDCSVIALPSFLSSPSADCAQVAIKSGSTATSPNSPAQVSILAKGYDLNGNAITSSSSCLGTAVWNGQLGGCLATFDVTVVSTPSCTTTSQASNLTSTSATAGGNISDTGGVPIINHGVCYSTSVGSIQSNCPSDTSSVSTGSFAESLSNLSPGTSYYYQAFAQNSVGTTYCTNMGSFTTPQSTSYLPDLTPDPNYPGVTFPTPVVAGSSTTFSQRITNIGSASSGPFYTLVRFDNDANHATYNTSLSKEIFYPNNLVPTGIATISASQTLPSAGTWYVQACADISNESTMTGTISESNEGNNCGNWTQITVTSAPAVPTCTSPVVTNITDTSATVGGTITSDGGATITSRGVAVKSSTGSYIYTDLGGTTGPVTRDIINLTPGATYYFQAWANNSVGRGYCPETSFTALRNTTINGVCAPVHYNCAAGTSSSNALSFSGLNSVYSWGCLGSNGGVPASPSCSETLSMSGTLTSDAPSCVIQSGQSSCNVTLTWGTTNPQGVSSVTSPTDSTGASVSTRVGTGDSGSQLVSIPYPGRTFFLYNNTKSLVPTSESPTGSGLRITATNSAPSAPDLIAATVSPTAANTGVSTTFSATITNQGTAATGTSFYNFFQKATGSGGTGTVTDLTATQMSALAAGGTGTASVSTSFPPAGTYSMRACADKSSSSNTGTITESNENNNCGPWTDITVTTPTTVAPDLVAGAVAPTTAIAGDIQPLSSVISNQGSLSTNSSFSVKFSVSASPSGTGASTINTTTMAALNSGTSATATVSYTFPSAGTYYVQACADSTNVITESNENNNCGPLTTIAVSVPLPVCSAPSVSTGTSASNITSSSATGTGYITSDGGCAVIVSGGVWSVSHIPTTADPATLSHTTDGWASGGPYNINMTSLSPSTPYYYRAYATNSAGKTGYGSETPFTTLSIIPPTCSAPSVSTTSPAASITQSSAVGGGTISSDGGCAVSVSGVVWGTSNNPTFNPNSGPLTGSTGQTTDGWASGGPWTDNMTGLSPSTPYYYRAYAENSAGIAYGNNVSFTTLSAACSVPSVTTGYPLSNIGYNSATGSGAVTWFAGDCPATVSGVVWSTASDPTYNPNAGAFSGSSGQTTDGTTALGSSWYDTMTGLSPVANYHYRAYAVNSAGVGYGNDVAFSTTVAPPNAMTGTLSPSANSCVISQNGNSCYINLSWNTTNPAATSAVTSSYPSANTVLFSGNSGTNELVWIPYNSRDLYLYNNGTLLDSKNITSSCAPGTTWNNSACIPSGSPVSVSITADSTQIALGGSTTLRWTSAGASSCSVTSTPPGFSSNLTAGSATIQPSATTTYTAHCGDNLGNSASDSVTVRVSLSAPSVTLTANPAAVAQGSPSTLSWTSANASYCYGSNFNVPASGPSTSGSVSVSPAATTTYTIICVAPDGTQVTGSATVTVLPPGNGGKAPVYKEK